MFEALIQAHDDVRIEAELVVDGLFRREHVAAAVDVGLERVALFGDFASLARENTWKPPLSVRMGPSQCMNRCRPAKAVDDLASGAQVEVVGVAQNDLGAGFSVLPALRALTVARVPTGMNTGVSTRPWIVSKTPALALSDWAVNLKSITRILDPLNPQSMNIASP
jgi:hypothetical protein